LVEEVKGDRVETENALANGATVDRAKIVAINAAKKVDVVDMLDSILYTGFELLGVEELIL